MKNRITNIIGILIVLFLWEIIAITKKTPALPSGRDIFSTLIKSLARGEYTKHVFASLEVAFWGLLIAILGAFTVGVVVYYWNTARQLLMPIVDTVRNISGLILMPLLIILVGVGVTSRIIIIFWTAWPAVLISVIHSLNIEKDVIEASQLDGASNWDIMCKIRIPLAAPGIMTGIRIGVWGGWISLVVAEMLGASSGLGFWLLLMSQSFNFRQVYATIIVIVFIGGSLNFGLNRVQAAIDKRMEKGEIKDEKSSSFVKCPAVAYRNNLFAGMQKYFR